MRSRCAFVFVFLLAVSKVEAAGFEPTVGLVCSAKPGDSTKLVLYRSLLRRELDHTKGATIVDLINFLNRHRKLPDPQKGGIDTTSRAFSWFESYFTRLL